MRRLPDGSLEVVTAAANHAEALVYPALAAPATGRYEFTLRYIPRYIPRSGFFSFGVRPPDGTASEQISVNASSYLQVNERELNLWINLTKGQIFDLRIANNNDFTDRPASFFMQQVTGAFIPSQP